MYDGSDQTGKITSAANERLESRERREFLSRVDDRPKDAALDSTIQSQLVPTPIPRSRLCSTDHLLSRAESISSGFAFSVFSHSPLKALMSQLLSSADG